MFDLELFLAEEHLVLQCGSDLNTGKILFNIRQKGKKSQTADVKKQRDTDTCIRSQALTTTDNKQR